eukprot:comp7551_c0_seq1/m.3207 comp7551_c0_seq1/g.3207  ORF comp7551_c0_seq1/g.3207 comp7551_c0_seq1/m.3207 type:complete len:354 (-) comp7551_c0_seq1:288-1349(-)
MGGRGATPFTTATTMPTLASPLPNTQLQSYGTITWPESEMKHLAVPIEVPSRQVTIMQVGAGENGEPTSTMITLNAPLGWIWIPMGVVFDSLPEGISTTFPSTSNLRRYDVVDETQAFVSQAEMGSPGKRNIGNLAEGFSGDEEGSLAKKQKNARLRFRCEHEGCNYGTYFKADFQKHVSTHIAGKPFACPHEGCTATFKLKQSVDNHVKAYHMDKPLHKCTFEGCTYETIALPTLRQHMLRHTGEKPHKCSYEGCGKAFRSKSACTGHETLHMREGKYTCDTCGFKFNDFTTYRTHVRNHFGPNFTMCPHHGCIDAFDNHFEFEKHAQFCKYKGGLPSSGSIIAGLSGAFMS